MKYVYLVQAPFTWRQYIFTDFNDVKRFLKYRDYRWYYKRLKLR